MAEHTKPHDIDIKALNALIARVEHAIEHNLALSIDDLKLLLSAITTLCTLQQKMDQRDITLLKLRKLLGMVQQSERRRKTTHSSANDKDGKGKGHNKKTQKKRSVLRKRPLRLCITN